MDLVLLSMSMVGMAFCTRKGYGFMRLRPTLLLEPSDSEPLRFFGHNLPFFRLSPLGIVLRGIFIFQSHFISDTMAAFDMIGQIALFAGAYTPRHWKRCDGSILNIVEYRALFDIIGDTYGGNGTTTFALPNLGGRYMVCAQGTRPNLRPEAWSEILPPGEDSPVEYVQSVTYAELSTLISGSDLVPGKQYLITDFAARWYAVTYDSNTLTLSAVSGSEQTGVTEPLIVTAVTASAIHNQCLSTLHPTDILEYEPSSTGFLSDPYYSISSTIISSFKGVITRRTDMVADVDCFFDWRNLTFRRWALNPATWSNATAYVVGDAVVASNLMYVCIQAHTNQTPSSAVTYWQKMLSANLSTDPYWSTSDALFRYRVGATTSSCPVTSAYTDYKVFGAYATNSVKIGKGASSNSACNNVFKQGAANNCSAISISYQSSNNTTDHTFRYNVIDAVFYSNIIGTSFQNNIVGSNFGANFILNTFTYNNIGSQFNGNCVAGSFSYNDIGFSFSNCLIKSGFVNNHVDTSFSTINYTAATLVYVNHRKSLFKSPDTTKWLMYISDAGVVTVASHTA